MLADPIEAVDPHRRLPIELPALLRFAEQVLLALVRLRAPNPVRVVRLVVHDQEVSPTSRPSTRSMSLGSLST